MYPGWSPYNYNFNIWGNDIVDTIIYDSGSDLIMRVKHKTEIDSSGKMWIQSFTR
jgi:hypothetical protein